MKPYDERLREFAIEYCDPFNSLKDISIKYGFKEEYDTRHTSRLLKKAIEDDIVDKKIADKIKEAIRLRVFISLHGKHFRDKNKFYEAVLGGGYKFLNKADRQLVDILVKETKNFPYEFNNENPRLIDSYKKVGESHGGEIYGKSIRSNAISQKIKRMLYVLEPKEREKLKRILKKRKSMFHKMKYSLLLEFNSRECGRNGASRRWENHKKNGKNNNKI